ncbi:MAG: hypothetical protein HYZ72_03560 [Deltaproteobacteria bacterium]|nr:hypothetical protein [Deltaproteobacteria bacterium]
MNDKPRSPLGALTPARARELEAMRSQPPRQVRFPASHSMGALWVRDRGSDGYAFWEPYGDTQGVVTVPGGKELRLNVTPQASTDLSPLAALQPDDVQYLQLSSTRVNNAGLSHLRGLTGLRVLWLYDTQVSDAGLVHLQGLTGLRVLNLRSTLVSRAGVDALQQALPQCEFRRAWK